MIGRSMFLAAPTRRVLWRRQHWHTGARNRHDDVPTTVSIVYGSFTPHGTARRNAHAIHHVLSSQLSASPSYIVAAPLDGTSFDFNSLAADDARSQQQKRLLIIATSSMFGQPPDAFIPFAHNLLLTATTNPGCLTHLQHAVWGAGDPKWWTTYMNVPRYTDQLLETCGSRRLVARGEAHEPYLDAKEGITVEAWAERLCHALIVRSTKDDDEDDVPWDALWQTYPTTTHQQVTGFTLRELFQTQGCLAQGPSALAKPEDDYQYLVDRFTEPEEEDETEDAGKGGTTVPASSRRSSSSSSSVLAASRSRVRRRLQK